MPRGGYRPGAGRPRGSGKMRKTASAPPSAAPAEGPLDPVTYLTGVMNDPAADPARRDRAASLLLPYTSPRLSDNRRGPRHFAREAALRAGRDSDWGDDLAPIEPKSYS